MTSNYDAQLTDLIETTIKQGGSDLHLSAGYHPTIRVSGLLIPLVAKDLLTAEDMKGLIDVLLTPANKELFMSEKELDFSYSYRDTVRFRGNCSFSQRSHFVSSRKTSARSPNSGFPTRSPIFRGDSRGSSSSWVLSDTANRPPSRQ
jgi:twitching motility protein PilT